ncbi:cytochrome c oxidase assembly factor Coa1 family protein [Dokdonia sp.]|uniref:cytochrome c oxidase assembly factor Coa1 family protein n=1 Tax=Dokdonia sp. TaxID=2024995 RepID=UPI0032637898
MEQEIQQSWWKRNWKWALPTGGCLTILIVVFSIIGFGAYKVFNELSNDTSALAFVKVVMEVQKNKEVANALGKPIDIRDGDFDPEMADLLDLEMQLEGKKSDGILTVKAVRIDDTWVYSVFTVTVEDTGEVIDLIRTVNN